METDETRLGGANASFGSTHWTNLFRARDANTPEGRDALEKLIHAYWKPVYLLVRKRGYPVEAAKDFTQGFFAAFLEKDYLRYVVPGRGKFRAFLRTAITHYLADEHDRSATQKRGGEWKRLSLDFAEAEAEAGRGAAWDQDPDRVYCRKWALAVLRRALDVVQSEYAAAGRAEEFDVLVPYLTGEAKRTYAEGAARLSLSAYDFTNRLNRLRRRYRETVLAEIRQSTESELEAQEELRELFASLRG